MTAEGSMGYGAWLDRLSRSLAEAAKQSWEGADADALRAARRVHSRSAAVFGEMRLEQQNLANLRATGPALRRVPDELRVIAGDAGSWAEPLVADAIERVAESGSGAGQDPTVIAARALYVAAIARAKADADLKSSRRLTEEADRLEESLPRRRDAALADQRSRGDEWQEQQLRYDEAAARHRQSVAELADVEALEREFHDVLRTVLRIWSERDGEAAVGSVLGELVAAGAPEWLVDEVLPPTNQHGRGDATEWEDGRW